MVFAEYYSYSKYFNQTVHILNSNNELLTALKNNDIAKIKDKAEYVYNTVLLPYNADLAIYNDQEPLFSTKKSLYNYSELFFIQDTLQSDIQNSFVLTDEGVDFLALSPIQLDDRYSICISISDSSVLSSLVKTNNTLFVVIDETIVSPKYPDLGQNQKYVTKANGNKLFLDSILTKIDVGKKQQNVKVNNRRHCIVKITDFVDEKNQAVAGAFYSIDITTIQKEFTRQIAQLTIVVFLILTLIILTLYLFQNRIIGAALFLKKSLEEQLRERSKEIIDKNQQFSQIFNSTANGLRIIDSDFNVLQVNDAFCRISGVFKEKAIGSKCFNVFPSIYCHTDNCPLEQIKNGNEVVSNTEERFSRLGEKVVCNYSAKRFEGKHGEFIGIIEDFKDITELALTEYRHKETQKQFESLLNSMPVGVFIRDFEGNMFYQNSYMDKAFGPFNFEKKNIKYVFPTTQVSRFFEEDKFVEKSGSVIVEEQLIDNNKIERTYVTHKFKFSGANNQPLIGGVSIDISKRKQAEHNAYVLSKAINNIPIGVVITSPKGEVEFCNPEFEAISSTSADMVLGTIFPPFEPENTSSHVALAKAIGESLTGSVCQDEAMLSFYEGENQWYAFSVSPVFNRHGDVAHLILVFNNITERKESEKQMVIAKTKAEESDRLKTAFLSNLSHEIRTPLNAILGFSSLLNNSTISYEEKLDIPNQLLRHSNELLDLINDLIDISSIETNQLTIKKRECKLNETLQNVFSEFIEHNNASRLKTYLKLGVAEESFTILTDPDRLAQIVKHLLSNALKFTSKGFIELGYTFRDPSTLLFYVIDTGVGLLEKEKDIIFNPFRQADDSTTRCYSGLGLGLAIARNVVERLGGKIWVNSSKNEGSTFFFTLPYIPVRAKFDEFIPPNKFDEYNWKNKTILVADDIDSNFMFIQTLVKPTGANLVWARNGKEAISIAKSREIDVVLMDIVMPEVDGFEATKQIKQYRSDIKVICQTAYPSPEHQKAGIESGMDKFLTKPIPVNSILEAIDEYIAN
jgi:PAS domain S-box-containing protein